MSFFSARGISDLRTKGNSGVLDVSVEFGQGQNTGLVFNEAEAHDFLASVVALREKRHAGEVVFQDVNLSKTTKKKLRLLRPIYQFVDQIKWDNSNIFGDSQPIIIFFRKYLKTHLPNLEDVGIKEIIEVALVNFRLEMETCYHIYRDLSLHEQWGVSLALATCLEPDLLILDDCFEQLEQIQKYNSIFLLKSFIRNNPTTLLFLTKSIVTAAQLCSQIYICQNGEIVEHGDTKAIIGNPQHALSQDLITSIEDL